MRCEGLLATDIQTISMVNGFDQFLLFWVHVAQISAEEHWQTLLRETLNVQISIGSEAIENRILKKVDCLEMSGCLTKLPISFSHLTVHSECSSGLYPVPLAAENP